MARKAKKEVESTESEAPKISVYDRITNRIIESLEAGALPWRKPWRGNGNCRFTRPLRACGTPYNGINVIVLWWESEEKGYNSPYWFTFNQARELGAMVRKGEKSTRVVYASTFSKEVESESGEKSEAKIPFLKEYCVFNAQQIDGLPEKYLVKTEPAEPINTDSRDDAADAFIRNTGADIRHGGNSAYYTSGADFIKLPDYEQFETCADYVSTAAHELTHWTGAKSRLDREFGKRFGDAAYAFEELIAELGAAYICADLGMPQSNHCNHVSYLAHWLEVLKNDKRAIFTAASQASRAAEYLHSLQPAAAPVSAEELQPA